jgi:hypothetical protein
MYSPCLPPFPNRYAATNNSEHVPFSIARFRLSQLKGNSESRCDPYTHADYHVDLIASHHTLLDVVAVAFDVLKAENMTHDGVTTHAWTISVGDHARCHHRVGIICNDHVRLDSLGLVPGDVGSFCGASASFVVTLVDCDAPMIKNTIYPKLEAIAVKKFSERIDTDWIDDAAKVKAELLRGQFQQYYGGDNSWKRCKKTGDANDGYWVPTTPTAAGWSASEIKLMSCFKVTDCSFQAVWKNVLQYALVDRSELETSQRWINLQQQQQRWIGECKGKAGGLSNNDELVRAGKRRAQVHLEKALLRGPPQTPELHPWKRALKSSGQYAQQNSLLFDSDDDTL